MIGDRLRYSERIPGFGHAVYRVDRRGSYLLGRLREILPEHRLLAIADEMLAVMRRRHLPAPNTDLAVAALARMAGMMDGAAAPLVRARPPSRTGVSASRPVPLVALVKPFPRALRRGHASAALALMRATMVRTM